MHTRTHLWTLLLSGAIATVLCVWACSQHGIGLTDDSGWYSFSAHFGITKTFFNDSLTTFPPLYPLLLSFYKFTPLSFFKFALLLNIAAYWFTIIAWYKISENSFSNTTFKILFAISSTLNIAIIFNVYMLWSESIFIAFISWSIYFFIKYLNEKRNTALILSSLLIILAFYERYAALLILPAFFLFLISDKQSYSRKIIFFVLPVSFFIAFWMTRNILIRENIVGYDDAEIGLLKNITIVADLISAFIFPDEIPLWIRIILLFGICITVIRIRGTKNAFILTIIISYSVSLIILNSIKNIQIPDERYLSPVLFPFIYLLFSIAEKYYIHYSGTRKRIMLVILVLWTLYPLSRTYVNVQRAHTNGIGYHDTSWGKIDLLRKIDSYADFPLFSNNPAAVVLLNEKKCLALPALMNPQEKEAYVIQWNNQNRLPYLNQSLEDYSKYYNFTELYSSPDGKIYKATAIATHR